MSKTVKEEVADLQKIMIGALAKACIGLPDRFTIEPGVDGWLIIHETTTGKKLQVGLCDIHGAIKTLKFFC